jgi:ribosomal-protein-alanine N-acetyltransferase
VIDATLFAQNTVVALESMGYGICYIGGLRNRLSSVVELLEIPDGVWPLYGLCVGVPAQDPETKPRLPIDAVLHRGRYASDEDLREMIEEYDGTMSAYYERREKPGWNWSGALSRRFSHPQRSMGHDPHSPDGLPRVRLRRPRGSDEQPFIDAVVRSRKLHGDWAAMPADVASFRAWLGRCEDERYEGLLLEDAETHELVGNFNLGEICRGNFMSAYLGYNAFVPYAGRGYMSAGLRQVLRFAFVDLGLHRLEANIQPSNLPSLRLVERAGFRREGYSPRYLYLAGEWRDHERWAIVADEWRDAP